MAPKNPKALLGIPQRASGKDLGYQKNQNLVKAGPEPKNFQVTRVKTDGRIGSTTPPQYLKGGNASVRNNAKAQSHRGGLGSVAAKHMGPGHEGGDTWAPRVAKARAQAAAGRGAKARPHTEPVNHGLRFKHIKPD